MSKPVFPTVSNHRITSSFGYRVHPISKKRTLHTGTDIAPKIAGTTGVPIYATQDGIVKRSRSHNTMGNYIYLKHLSDGYSSVYMHMARLLVKEGQRVKKGQQIGIMGTTGNSTGIHLHFMISKSYPPQHNGSNLIDPMTYLKGVKKVTLAVDGKRGKATIRRWQEFFGTPQDGIISKPSTLIRKWQTFLNKYGGAKLKVDGYEGTETIKAGQRFFGTTVDGKISSTSEYVKALQRFLNEYGR